MPRTLVKLRGKQSKAHRAHMEKQVKKQAEWRSFVAIRALEMIRDTLAISRESHAVETAYQRAIKTLEELS